MEALPIMWLLNKGSSGHKKMLDYNVPKARIS